MFESIPIEDFEHLYIKFESFPQHFLTLNLDTLNLDT